MQDELTVIQRYEPTVISVIVNGLTVSAVKCIFIDTKLQCTLTFRRLMSTIVDVPHR